MKRISKKSYIFIAVGVIAILYFIGMYHYRKPLNIHKTVEKAIVIEAGTKTIVKAEINAKLYRGIYAGSIGALNPHFTNRIEGEITIDGKGYKFEGANGESKPINIIGSVHENKLNDSTVFWFKMYDLDSIELLSHRSSS